MSVFKGFCNEIQVKWRDIRETGCPSIFSGSMSIVGVGFYKSRSIIAFEAIFMFFVQMHIFLHGK